LCTTIDRKSLSGPWTYNQTADVAQPGGLPDLTAHMLAQSQTRTMELLTGSTWRTSTTTSYDNGDGQVAALDLAPAGSPETCTATSYATPPSGNPMMQDYPDQVTAVTGAASGGTCPAASSADIVSGSQTYYDDEAGTLTSMGALGSLASPGGLATGVRRAATWPAAGSETWQQQSATSYDAYGRVVSSTNADGKTSTTAYTPAYAAGTSVDLPTQTTVTNPMGWKTTTGMDEARQLPVKDTDVNGEVTTETYDALGRLLSVTLPADQSPGDPTEKFAYTVPGTAPSTVTTSTLREDGSYSQSVSIYDGMLQLRQVQQTPANAAAGRLLTDTFYDSHGWPVETRRPYYDATTSPGTTLDVTGAGSIPGRTLTSYDGQGRVTASAFYSGNTKQWQATTAYPTASETDVTPPPGGTATSTFTDAVGQTTASYAYTTATPNGIASDADVTSYTYAPAGQIATVADNAGNTSTYAYNLLGEKTASTDPGATGTAGPSAKAGNTSYAYDASGNLTSQTSPLGQQLSYVYDSLGRKTAEYSGTATGTQLAAWAYDKTPLNAGTADALGQPTSSTSYTSGASGPAFTEKVTGYDVAYQATGTSTVIPAVAGSPGGTYTTTSTYTPLTELPDTTAYSGDGGLPAETVNYSENLQGGMEAFGGNAPYLDNIIYSPLGQAERANFGAAGKQLVQTYTDDPATSRLLTTTTNLQTLTAAADTTNYTYNPAGDITSVSDAQNTGGTQTQCFSYNNLNQLTTAWTDTGSTTTAAAPSVPGIGGCTHTSPAAANIGGPAPYWESYGYDLLGDRTSQTSFNTAGIAADNITQTISYAGSGTTLSAQPDAATRIVTQFGTTGSSDTTTPAYDAAGDTTSQVTTTTGASPPPAPPAESKITYDPQGQAATVADAAGTSSYTYDAAGNLIVEADPGKVTYFADGGAEEIIYNTAASPATVTAARFYPAPDGTVVVRSSSAVISYETGNQQGTAQESVTASTQAITRRYYDPYGSPVGAVPVSWPDGNGFLGRPADPATSLDLLGARQYDAATGRFLSLDPVLEAGDPSQMGGYSYAADNPASGSDPTGLTPGIPRPDPGGGGSGPSPVPSPPSGSTPGIGGPGHGGPGPGSGPGSGPGGEPPVASLVAAQAHPRQLAAAYTAQLALLTGSPRPPAYLEWLALAHACTTSPGMCGSDLRDFAYHSGEQGQYSYQLAIAAYERQHYGGGGRTLLLTAGLAFTAGASLPEDLGLMTAEAGADAAVDGVSVFRTARLGYGQSELDSGLDVTRFATNDRSAYVGDEAAARSLADPRVGGYENGYSRFDMHSDFELEFSKFKYDYPEGGPGSYEYQIPQSMIGRFNDLTLNRVWTPFQ
jgi:RHS repeat-associated protein